MIFVINKSSNRIFQNLLAEDIIILLKSNLLYSHRRRHMILAVNFRFKIVFVSFWLLLATAYYLWCGFISSTIKSLVDWLIDWLIYWMISIEKYFRSWWEQVTNIDHVVNKLTLWLNTHNKMLLIGSWW